MEITTLDFPSTTSVLCVFILNPKLFFRVVIKAGKAMPAGALVKSCSGQLEDIYALTSSYPGVCLIGYINCPDMELQ